jgi:hypothetical protein
MNIRITKWLAEVKRDSIFAADTRHCKTCSNLFSCVLKEPILLSAIRAKKECEYAIKVVDASRDR